jgi:hypothetical protein
MLRKSPGEKLAGLVAALVVVVVVGLAGLIAFGTKPQPPALTSVSDPI